MKLKYNFEPVEMGDEIVCVPVGDGTEKIHGVLKLNKSGKYILDLLKEETSIDTIVESISKNYSNDSQELYVYVEKTVQILCDAGLIEVS